MMRDFPVTILWVQLCYAVLKIRLDRCHGSLRVQHTQTRQRLEHKLQIRCFGIQMSHRVCQQANRTSQT